MKNIDISILTAIAIMTMGSCNDTPQIQEGYIGPCDPEVENGIFTEHTMLQLGRLSGAQISPDGNLLLYGVTYVSTEENRTCRNIFICAPDGSDRKQLTFFGKSVGNERFSPDGKQVWFTLENQIWKAPLTENGLGEKEKVSDVKRGVSGFELSPDGSKLFYISSIPGPVKSPSDIDSTLDKAQAYIADDLMYRHWDHWVTETPRSYIAATTDGLITEDNSTDILSKPEDAAVEMPTEPFGGTEQLCWSADSRYIAFSCRKLTGREYAFSTNTDIFIYDTVTGKELKVTAGGGYDTDPVWSPDGCSLAWISMKRDGYEADAQRIMLATLVPAAPGAAFPLEMGTAQELASDLDADKCSLVWSGDGKTIFFNATVKAIGGIFAVGTAEGSPTRRITPEQWMYSFGNVIRENHENGTLSLLTSYQSMTFPTELCRVTINTDGTAQVENISHENDRIINKLAAITQEEVWLGCENGDSLHSWVLYPPHFDANKKYPAIEMLNGGPQTSLDQTWSYRWNFLLMAHKGYVVILPGRHGDSGWGQAWKEQISGDYCGLNMKDYILAGEYIKSRDYVGKLAAVGASYGGYSAYMMEGLQDGLFDCIISHAGIFDEKALWFTTEEMWFANWDNGGLEEYACIPGKTGPEGDGRTFGGIKQGGAPYAEVPKAQKHYANSPDTKVTKWKTPILCMHGMMDFRIPYTQGMAAFNAARMMGVSARLVIFPQETHWVLQPQNALLWQHEFFNWTDKWTKN